MYLSSHCIHYTLISDSALCFIFRQLEGFQLMENGPGLCGLLRDGLQQVYKVNEV